MPLSMYVCRRCSLSLRSLQRAGHIAVAMCIGRLPTSCSLFYECGSILPPFRWQKHACVSFPLLQWRRQPLISQRGAGIYAVILPQNPQQTALSTANKWLLFFPCCQHEWCLFQQQQQYVAPNNQQLQLDDADYWHQQLRGNVSGICFGGPAGRPSFPSG